MTRKEAIKDLQRSIDLGLCPSKESRKMAIKALEQEHLYIDKPRGYQAHSISDEKTCDYYDPEIKTCRRSEVPETGEWIDVKDRIPERTAWIICTDGKNISVEKYKKDGIDHFFPRGRWFDTEDMVAWMELPDPYKEESEE